jgi:hypothetical protein
MSKPKKEGLYVVTLHVHNVIAHSRAEAIDMAIWSLEEWVAHHQVEPRLFVAKRQKWHTTRARCHLS